jgi:hypothetical protein
MIRLTSPYLCSDSLPRQNMQQRLFNLDGFKFSLPFVGQNMLEIPFPFYEEFVVACAYTQDTKFVRHI